MPSTTRPMLDAMTTWRVGQIMNREGRRSIADTIAVAVADYWDRGSKVEEARCFGLFTDSSKEKAITIGVHLPPKIGKLVETLADREHRSLSNAARLLIAESLAARGVFRPED